MEREKRELIEMIILIQKKEILELECLQKLVMCERLRSLNKTLSLLMEVK